MKNVKEKQKKKKLLQSFKQINIRHILEKISKTVSVFFQ